MQKMTTNMQLNPGEIGKGYTKIKTDVPPKGSSIVIQVSPAFPMPKEVGIREMPE